MHELAEQTKPRRSQTHESHEAQNLGDLPKPGTSSPEPADHGSAVEDFATPDSGSAAQDITANIDRPTISAELPDLEPASDHEPAGLPIAQGTHIGRYVIVDTLGKGGMGVVYRALDRTLDRHVAIKVLQQDVGTRHQQRLVREAKALALLSHPNVVQVYEVSMYQGRSFVVMELVQGQTLRQWQRRLPRPDWRACVRTYLQAAEGLAAAHRHDLVHRDFKPSNAIIDDQGRVRVLDFGLARTAAEVKIDDANPPPEPPPRVPITDRADENWLTETGIVLGTPAYMSLEQIHGEEVDTRSDQFSLCVSLFEAVYGVRPFAGQTIEKQRDAIRMQRLAPMPAHAQVPATLRKILARGLAPEPENRWPSMEALIVELRSLLQPRARRSTLVALVGGGSLALAGGLVFWGYTVYESTRVHQAELAERCSGAQAQLEGIWGDDRREQIEAAMLGTQRSYAADVWERVEPRLDDYASAWMHKYTEVCEATRVTQEQNEEHMELRMSCLRKHKAALREAVGVLTTAEATVVKDAITLVTSLPELSRCDDVDALSSGLPPPEDALLAERVELEREDNEKIWALQRAGSYDHALAEANAAVARADALEYGPLLAETLYQRGVVYVRRGQYIEAEVDLERVYTLSIEHGYDALTLDSVTLLVLVVGQHLGRFEAGLQWGKTALALALGPNGEPLDEATVRHHVGRVLVEQGKLEEALVHSKQTLALYQEFGQTDTSKWTDLLVTMGHIMRHLGKTDEAQGHFQHALDISEQALGPRHPDLVLPLNNLGIIMFQMNEHERALAYYRRAEALMVETFGSRHPKLLAVLNNIAIVLRSQKELDDAMEYYQRAASISEQTQGPSHPRQVYPLVGIARVALEQGNLPRAREAAERAVSICEAKGLSPMLTSMSKFVFARALWASPAERGRARDLAEQAYDPNITSSLYRPRMAEIERWLAEHPLP